MAVSKHCKSRDLFAFSSVQEGQLWCFRAVDFCHENSHFLLSAVVLFPSPWWSRNDQKGFYLTLVCRGLRGSVMLWGNDDVRGQAPVALKCWSLCWVKGLAKELSLLQITGLEGSCRDGSLG